MKWLKRLALPVGVLVVVIGSIVQIKMKEAGDGKMVLFAPPDAPVQLVVDGKPLDLPAGGFFRMTVKQGAHKVEVPGVIAHEVVVKSGRDVLGVPTRPDQCFEELDVTLSHYGSTAGKTGPTVARAFKFSHPFQLGEGLALDERELPKTCPSTIFVLPKIVDVFVEAA
jgi:hypothetical protein